MVKFYFDFFDSYIFFWFYVCYNYIVWGDTMLEIILGSVVAVTLIILIFVVYHNKFQISVIKMEEAENNIELFLQKKLDLLKRAQPIIKKELKMDEFLEQLEDTSIQELNYSELNDTLKLAFNDLFKVLDDNEKLFKSESLVRIVDDINTNEIDLVAAVKFYNDTVVTFNQLIVSFPSNIIRLFFGYKRKDFYNHEKREIYEILKDN